MKAVSHARQRAKERYGLDITNRVLKEKEFDYIERQTCSRSLCKFKDEDIWFILNRKKMKIITFLPTQDKGE